MSDPKDKAPADPRIGTVLSERFRVDALLGKGGMGAVYRAEHVHMKKTVAVKVLHREMTGLDEIVKRFEREAIAAGRITHPNVASALDFGQLPDGSFYLVLEYVPGKSLRDTLAGGQLPLARVLGIGRQVASALAAAHAVEIVHRDLKPDNVMLIDKGDGKDFVKVLDFGIAKVAGVQRAGTQLTQMGTVFGTPQYMSPEQAAGQSVDHRADLYALGLMLHEMLTGRPTFQSEELIVLITMQLTAAPPPLPAGVPQDVARLVMRLLDKSPSERPDSATEVAAELDAAIRRIESGGGAAPSGSARAAELAHRMRDWAARVRPLLQRARTTLVATGRRRIAGRVPVWAVAAGVSVAAVGWLALGERQQTPRRVAAHRNSTEGTESNDEPASERRAAAGDGKLDPELENLVMLASRGDPGAVSQLKKRAPDEGSPRVWLALARGLLRSRDVRSALDAYRRAIELDGALTDDSTMLNGLGYFGSKDDSFDAVLDFAVNHMGERGADLVFFIWSATSERTAATQRAKELLSSRAVAKEMSEGLKLALAVRNAQGCDEFKELLPKLRDAGDERSYAPLRDLSRTTGCGPDGREDCYQCLRDDSLLKDALVQVQLRKAPHFETRRWR